MFVTLKINCCEIKYFAEVMFKEKNQLRGGERKSASYRSHITPHFISFHFIITAR